MKVTISKEQSTELRKWLEKQRLPRETIDTLLGSANASNTYKSYRQKKQITTADGWAIHFGANWARQIEKDEAIKAETEDETDTVESGLVNESEPETAVEAEAEAEEAEVEAEAESKTKSDPDDIKAAGDTVVSRTFMGLAEKLKKLKIEDVDKP